MDFGLPLASRDIQDIQDIQDILDILLDNTPIHLGGTMMIRSIPVGFQGFQGFMGFQGFQGFPGIPNDGHDFF